MKVTINGGLVAQKTLRERLNDLKSLRMQNTNSTSMSYGDRVQTTEPKYDVKVLDKRVVEIQNALFQIEQAIKQANALTNIDIDVDLTILMRPLD